MCHGIVDETGHEPDSRRASFAEAVAALGRQAAASLVEIGRPPVPTLMLALHDSRAMPFRVGLAEVLGRMGPALDRGWRTRLARDLSFLGDTVREPEVQFAIALAAEALQAADPPS